LTRSLLAFSRQQPLSPKTIDVRKLLQEVGELVRRTVPENIDIEMIAGIGLWKCVVDPGELQNAVLNLITNARDAMPDGGRLTIETSNASLDDRYAAANAEVEPGRYVTISVSDTGHGMSPGVVARAFDPFFTTKEVGKGSGLGLSMAYGFAKQSKGYIKIYSEVGLGTTVRIYLPRSTASVEEATPEPSDDSGRSKGETILVVEDDVDVRSMTVSLLRSIGYDVLEADGPQRALRLAQENPHIALLLTDVVLPGGMNGRQSAEEISRKIPHLKVLYMSGYTDNAIQHHGRLDPGVHLLQKPFGKRELGLKVRVLLDARELELTRGKRLLVIDDEGEFAEFVTAAAAELGYAVTATTRATDFQRAYREHAPDAIILDMVMPEMNGIELIEWLIGQGCKARILIVSGFNPLYPKMAQLLAESRGKLSASTLQKPVELVDISAFLNEA
jgi:CheY-like chemotaxis protein